MSGGAGTAFNCPRCGERLAGVSASALLDCPACASPLAVHVPGEAVRESIAPAKSADAALHAASGFWTRDDVPKTFATIMPDAPVLIFAAVGEAHRTRVEGSGRGVASDTLDVALAAPIPGVPLEKADLPSLLAQGAREPFDPAKLQKAGLVFDPIKGPAQLFPAPERGSVLEERLGVVYVPFWLVRKRFKLGLYEAVVDAGTGRVIHGRAPATRTRTLVQAAVLVYFLAAVLAMPLRGWERVAGALLNLDEPGVAMLFFIPAGLIGIAAWAWDRLRFRYEVDGDGVRATLVPINRPDKTFLERARDNVAKGTAWVLGKIL